jgi:hypothetical protein
MGTVIIIQFAQGVHPPNVLFTDVTEFTRIVPM